MSENKLKHLDFLQTAIARMGQNSLLVKGWSLTLASALFVLSAKDSNPKFVFIPIPGILLFWWLDSFFYTSESRFRRLYDDTALEDETNITFSMNPLAKSEGWIEPARNMFAKTLWPFHLTLIACIFLFSHSLTAPLVSAKATSDPAATSELSIKEAPPEKAEPSPKAASPSMAVSPKEVEPPTVAEPPTEAEPSPVVKPLEQGLPLHHPEEHL